MVRIHSAYGDKYPELVKVVEQTIPSVLGEDKILQPFLKHAELELSEAEKTLKARSNPWIDPGPVMGSSARGHVSANTVTIADDIARALEANPNHEKIAELVVATLLRGLVHWSRDTLGPVDFDGPGREFEIDAFKREISRGEAGLGPEEDIGGEAGMPPEHSTGGLGDRTGGANGQGNTTPSDSKTYVRARYLRPRAIVMVDRKGKEYVREGGTRAWRNNNPGNIKKGGFTEANGAIGNDGVFAIFPDYVTGRQAVITLLTGPSYRDRTLAAAIARYAPSSENNTAAYQQFVSNKTGIPLSKRIRDFTLEQLESLVEAIQVKEGWRIGSTYSLESLILSEDGASLPASGQEQDWMSVAFEEARRPASERSEWRDPGENPVILNYFKMAAPWFDPKKGDEEDWCAAFVNYCLESSGYFGTNHPGARSFYWNKNKKFVQLDSPEYGAIAVFRDRPFSDESWRTGTGHVGFVLDSDKDSLEILGGNQGKTVKSKPYRKIRRNRQGDITRRVECYVKPTKL